ncbi:hypothetical protein GCM10010342_31580 [Streptomyces anulatus]|nr:hypothetical protein GCM10010342_31580 [Streptomyces anulatus]
MPSRNADTVSLSAFSAPARRGIAAFGRTSGNSPVEQFPSRAFIVTQDSAGVASDQDLARAGTKGVTAPDSAKERDET